MPVLAPLYHQECADIQRGTATTHMVAGPSLSVMWNGPERIACMLSGTSSCGDETVHVRDRLGPAAWLLLTNLMHACSAGGQHQPKLGMCTGLASADATGPTQRLPA